MDKAYDSILCAEIDAISLAKTSFHKGANYFRYQCLCCGEEVYLAAADSTIKTPHFRHRRGNNDTECEAYLGQPGAIERSVSARKRSQEPVSFYFNSDRMTFEIGVSFQHEDFERYESEQATLELKKGYSEKAFLTVPINSTVFVPDTVQYFTINEYSAYYYLSLFGKVYSFNGVIEDKNKLTFFRSRLQDERAKKVLSNYLYTNTRYVAICEAETCLSRLISFANVECISEPYEFITMGKRFFKAEISIMKSDYDLNLFLLNHNLHVETSETLNVVWPPVYIKDSDYVCESESVFVSSSFPLVYHGNTNSLCTTDELASGITKIRIENRTIINEKNVEVSLTKSEVALPDTVQEEVISITSSKWIVPYNLDYFLFDQDGCRKLTIEEKVYLSANDRIVGYRNNHIKLIVSSGDRDIPSVEEIIDDILKYHPQSEPYNPDLFLDLSLSESVVTYLEKCYRSGRINTVIKKYIEEGLL